MTPEQLNCKVANRLVNSTPDGLSIIAAGVITKQPATCPFRTVLVIRNNEYVVYDEIFRMDWSTQFDLATLCSNNNSVLEHGSYFPMDQLHKAVECFGKRIQQNAECVASIYRNE